MSIGRWIAVVVLAGAACVAPSSDARGPGPAGGAGMPRAGWGGGSWHGGWHHDGHWHGGFGAGVGIYLGPSFYWGWPYGPYAYDGWPYYDAYGYPYSYVYAYPNVTFAYPTDPSDYAAPGADDAAPEPPSFRYYCSEPKGYYPQVANCTKPWLRLLPSDPEPAGATSGAQAPSGQ